jgi:hypothetical protein
MSVYIACDHCQKRLKVPEEVVGRAIKCPSCGGVFQSDATKVLPDTAAPVQHAVPPVAEVESEAPVRATKKAVARQDQEGDLPRPRKKAALLDDDQEAVVPAKKKAAVVGDEDEDEVRPRKKKAVAVEDDDEEAPVPSRRKRRADEDEDEAEEEDRPRRGKRRTPWYVMLPLLILSFLGVGLPWLWAVGFTWLDMDRGVRLSFDSRVWIGISVGVGVTLLCLICSLIPARAWLRFLIVLILLALGYGGSFATIHWWNDLPFKEEEKQSPFQAPPPGFPGGRGGQKQGPPKQ